MPSILPPDTDLQAEDALKLLEDLAPPCEYSAHQRLRSTEPAVWIVWFGKDCCRPARVRMFCDPCFQYRRGSGSCSCNVCGQSVGPFETVIRVERL